MFIKVVMLVVFFGVMVGIGNAILGSLLAWVVLGRRTRVMTQHLDSAAMPDKDLVEDAFSCYEEKVLVPKSRALGEHN